VLDSEIIEFFIANGADLETNNPLATRVNELMKTFQPSDLGMAEGHDKHDVKG
jgi:hypothetical protein